MISDDDVFLKFLDNGGNVSTIRCHPQQAGQFTLHYQAKGWTLVKDAVQPVQGETAPAVAEQSPPKVGRPKKEQ